MGVHRVLVIDDLRIFIDYPGTITYARDKEAGYRNLLQEWEEVFLDHDLGESDIRPLIMDIAQAGHDGTPVKVKQFHVCSDNPAGRDWIIGTLAGAGYKVDYLQPPYRVDWGTTPA